MLVVGVAGVTELVNVVVVVVLLMLTGGFLGDGVHELSLC